MSAKALVVFSGGQDSTTCLALAHATFGADNVACVTFNYGQRHAAEIKAAQTICKLLGIEQHEIIDIGNSVLQSTSPLTDHNASLETYTDYASMDATIGSRIEKTFVPMRNALFLTLAANRAVCLGANVIYTGVCEADNANYPDCRLEFIQSQRNTINTALGKSTAAGAGLSINTPLIHMSKAQSIRMLRGLGTMGNEPRCSYFSLLAYSHTAYDGKYPPCGKDHASILRAQGFLEADVPDPLVLRAYRECLLDGLPDTTNYTDANIGTLDRLGKEIEHLHWSLV